MSPSPKKRGYIRRLLPYFKKYRKILLLDLLCAALSTVFSLVYPLIVSSITDRAIADITQITVSWILPMGALYLFLVLLEAGASYYMQAQGHIMGAMIETDMRYNLFGHLQGLSFNYYSNAKIGQIMSRLTTDLFDITEFAHHGPENLVVAGFQLTVSFIILLNVNVPLTLIIFALIPLTVMTTIFFNLRLRTAFRAYRHQVGEINAQAEDTLLGIRVVQSFTNEDIEIDKFEEGNQRFLDIKKKQYHAMAGYGATHRTLNGLMRIVVVIGGAFFLAKGKITPGDYAAYLLYINTLLASITQLVNFSEQFQRGTTALERYFSVMDTPHGIKDLPGAKELKTVKGTLTFENIDFSYPGTKAMVLSNLSMTVEVGQSVALVGPSGSGKTTLFNLIPRFWEPTKGRVLIDGQDVRNFTLKSLRGQIGIVQQDVYLFSGTIFDNIVYGRPEADMDEVIEAAKMAGAHEFISELPDGYHTYVGERGIKLSGGQKQRISIARVFLKNPPILLLDEATSSLDNESEFLVQQSLERLAHGRTTLTIAHRLSTIRNADRIWVLTENGLEESGTHDQLLALDGVYANLYHQSQRTNEVT